MWKIIGEIQGKSPSEPTSKVKALSRLVISSKQDLMEEWRKYFVNLINAPPVSSTADIPPAEVDLLIKTGAYTRTEVEVTIQSLKNSNAPSIDSFMCTEAIKYGGERLLNKLVTLLNLVKNNLVIPNEWKTFICVPLPKKGEPIKMSKYRSITLILITAILYNRILLNHVRDPREKILHVNQAGFRLVVA